MPRDSVADRPFQVAIPTDLVGDAQFDAGAHFDAFHQASGMRLDDITLKARAEYDRERHGFVEFCDGYLDNPEALRAVQIDLPRRMAAFAAADLANHRMRKRAARPTPRLVARPRPRPRGAGRPRAARRATASSASRGSPPGLDEPAPPNARERSS